jgi:hypothetical protein
VRPLTEAVAPRRSFSINARRIQGPESIHRFELGVFSRMSGSLTLVPDHADSPSQIRATSLDQTIEAQLTDRNWAASQ